MVRVFVVGVGMTKFEKPGRTGKDYTDFAKEAILKALQDSRLSYDDVQIATVGYVYGDSTSGQAAVYQVGMTGIPIFNVNNNCSTGSTALLLAKELIEGGKYDCALALGFEKMERGSLSHKFTDRCNPIERHMIALSELNDITPAPFAAQMFSNAGKEHMQKYGTTKEHFAKIALKNHKHSINNPYSQFRDEYTLQQILDSPIVSDPLTKLQCCPTSDGGACVVLASERFVKAHKLEKQAVEILALEMITDRPSTFESKSSMKIVGYDMSKTAAEKAFQKAKLKPSDVQVIELHDCFSANELITYEALGLCPEGQAARFIDRGDNTYGGKYVVNPSGGLISKGHPLGATGLAQCSELCWQLRGQADKRQVPNAKIALQHNIGLGGAVVVGLYKLGFPQAGNTGNQISNQGSFEDSFRVSKYFKLLEQAMAEDEENLIEKHRGIYGFRVKNDKGQEAFWVVNAKVGKGKIEFNNNKIKPDVIFIANDKDVTDLINGSVNPQKAFYQGKFKLQGNMGLALKLLDLQRSAAKKIELLRAKL